ncbi:imidazole glycerol phosphate synthase subunit HisH [Bacteroidia bacterium]|nr:imidazole glycerol phosphate synthase subunit HisH [Bacteroidia bacterium]GHT47472.1 imidazole glycerol phosphate synthase subunit HisH [Bacteroidia bacterium]
MIAVIDYKCGNLRSVGNALHRIGAEYQITSDPAVIRSASHVILPGVGEASSTMRALQKDGLDQVVLSLTQPVLGICIGMQLMCRYSEEGDVNCLGIFDTDVRKLPGSDTLKIPHIGWNTVQPLPVETRHALSLQTGLPDETYFYYVHSFAPAICEQTTAITGYGVPFSAILQNGNFFGTQFHPEKSGEAGEIMLKNFMKL